jgi:probable HAF family extracellular repeat protein
MRLYMMLRRRSLSMLAPVSVVTLMAAAASGQSITNIGVPAGATTSGANAVSANGSAVAASVFFESANRWSAGVFTNLGLTPGAFAAGTEDISHDGNAIVGSVFFITPEETARAYRWTAGGGMQELGTLPGGIASIGNGISGDGNVVTGASFDQDFNTTAFRWTSAGGMQSLGTLTGGTSSEGRRVSQNGSVIVGVSNTPNGERAFRWTESDGMQSLGLLAPTDSGSSAFGISADGSVVAGFSGSNAVIWTNSIAQDLGALPGADGAVAYTLNGDGSLVGGYSFFGFDVRATLWSQSLGLVDLNTYLPTLGIDLTGWELQYTRDISLDGSTIVGEGRFNGEFRGWVVNIPSPGAAGLFAVAALRIGRRRGR